MNFLIHLSDFHLKPRLGRIAQINIELTYLQIFEG